MGNDYIVITHQMTDDEVEKEYARAKAFQKYLQDRAERGSAQWFLNYYGYSHDNSIPHQKRLAKMPVCPVANYEGEMV
jgi:hypothetical protein